jgi:hypothetical protein
VTLLELLDQQLVRIHRRRCELDGALGDASGHKHRKRNEEQPLGRGVLDGHRAGAARC